MSNAIARAKFKLTKITLLADSSAKEYEFTTQYDETIAEDRRFFKYTPCGKFTMTVQNPEVEKSFTLGCCYYFDVTPS